MSNKYVVRWWNCGTNQPMNWKEVGDQWRTPDTDFSSYARVYSRTTLFGPFVLGSVH